MGEQLWSWETTRFENLDMPNVKTEVSASSWDVMIEKPNFAWGYAIPLPAGTQEYRTWRSRLEVRRALGDISPGIAFRGDAEGILFQVVPKSESAELRHVKVGERTEQTNTYATGDIVFPMDILLEYDAESGRCTASINGSTIFEVHLPHGNISPLGQVSFVEILTSTLPEGSGGTVGYGDITLQCE